MIQQIYVSVISKNKNLVDVCVKVNNDLKNTLGQIEEYFSLKEILEEL